MYTPVKSATRVDVFSTLGVIQLLPSHSRAIC